MVGRIVVISGAVAAGKSALAQALCERFGGRRYSTRQMLIDRVGESLTGRAELQAAGEALDVETGGSWIRDELSRTIYERNDSIAVVDAVRIVPQVDFLRESFGRRLVHVHVNASDETLRERYEDRRGRGTVDELPSYDDVRASPTEANIDELAAQADVLIDSDRCSVDDVLVRVASALDLLDGGRDALVDVLIGGEYGSEGKGNIVFHLAPEYDLLIRVGGPNAGHTVYLPDGTEYPHYQLPSGTRAAGNAKLLIGPGAVLNVPKLLKEIAECDVGSDRLVIDPQAMTIDLSDVEAEGALKENIGSTGQGVGVATARRILLRGVDSDERFPAVRLAGQVEDLRPYTERTAVEVLEDAYKARSRIMLEGTQGTGLSLVHGRYPHVTSRETSASGTMGEAGIAPHRVRRVVMVCRTYPIRVESPKTGDSGPMTKELDWSEVERRARAEPGTLAPKEKTTTTGRQRRVGEFEWDLLRRSALINAPTDIALTFVDYIDKDNAAARRFEQLTEETLYFIEEVERVTGAPVTLISTRFHPHRSIIDRRSW